jgi:putative hemin transport protein
LGYVTALTRNEDCIHERKGLYDQTICLQVQLDQWCMAMAVRDADNERDSIEFFSATGTALHKIILTGQSDRQAYEALVNRFKSSVQEPLTIQAAVGASAPFVHTETGSVQRELTVDDFKNLMAMCSDRDIPLLLTTGNEACVQQHSGTVKNLVGMGAWYHVNDAAFALHLREAAVLCAQYTVQSSAEGDIHWVTLLNQQGESILQVRGRSQPGAAEAIAWRDALAGFSA